MSEEDPVLARVGGHDAVLGQRPLQLGDDALRPHRDRVGSRVLVLEPAESRLRLLDSKVSVSPVSGGPEAACDLSERGGGVADPDMVDGKRTSGIERLNLDLD